MGLTKQYLRYVQSDKFNIINSPNCNVCFVVLQGQEGRFVAVGACEDVYIWDLRLGEKALVLTGEEAEVCCLAASSDGERLAVGHTDGSIRLFDLQSAELLTVFSGHRSPISCLAFDSLGHRLASGSKDTEIVTWDVVSETGLERLSGHKSVVTAVSFLRNKNILVSGSKDSHVKLWDLDTAHCFHTIAAHVTEVWGLGVLGEDEWLVVGTGSGELSVWSLLPSEPPPLVDPSAPPPPPGDVTCVKAGSILRQGKGRTVSLAVDNSARTLVVHGTDSTVEAFSFLDAAAANLRYNKRTAKQKKKAAKLGEVYVKSEMSLKDQVVRLGVIKASGKVKSVSPVQGKGELRVCVSLSNNKVEAWRVCGEEVGLVREITQQGHIGEVRALTFSSDSLAVVTVSQAHLKMWNRVSGKCLRTIELGGYGVSVRLVPGDRHALVGLKSGELVLVEMVAGDIIETVPAHSTELWALCLLHDKSGCLTGGGDNTVKEWKFELMETESGAKSLSVQHTRTLKLDDTVLSLQTSPCGKLLAVALLDSTVKIHYLDTFKFFISLYGHTMPVLSLDISFDSKLIVTGSGDKSVKIWGLDYGDCHKSLLAHDEAVTGVSFVPNTHQFFSVGKDGKVKHWDAGCFEKIITLNGHHGEGWGLSVCGDHVVSCGQDRCVRLYSKTEEIVVLEDEREEERARLDAQQLASASAPLLSLPSVKTVSAETSADLLMECLEAIRSYKAEESSGVVPTIPPLMAAYKATTTTQFLTKVLQATRASELGEVLVMLPFDLCVEMLHQLEGVLASVLTCELGIKVLVLVCRLHGQALQALPSALSLLHKLHLTAEATLVQLRDTVGVNLYALGFIERDYEQQQGVRLFKESKTAAKTRRDKKNRRRHLDKQNQFMTL